MNIALMAAGEGSRLRPLTDTTPKPLLQIAGKSIIEWNLDSIIDEIDEIFLIVKYKSEQFREYFGAEYRGKQIHYIEQIDQPGTGAAILSLEGHIHGDFVVMSGDDLYDGGDLRKLFQATGNVALCKRVEKPENFGIFSLDTSGRPIGVIEKPTDPSIGNLAGLGNYRFTDEIFSRLRKTKLSSRGEIEIIDPIREYIREGKFEVIEATGRWIAIGYPWDLLTAQEAIIGGYTETINKGAIIEPNVTIKGNLYLEEGVVIKSGTYIEGNCFIGKGAVIGPNSYIRGNTSIGRDSKIGAFVEVKNISLGDHSGIPHLSYVGDSVIGKYVNLGGGSKTANLRHDGANIRCMVKEKLIDTGRRKLGAIIGDGTKLAINTLIYPGRVIPTGGTTIPGEIVK